jgi:hypothetical protein
MDFLEINLFIIIIFFLMDIQLSFEALLSIACVQHTTLIVHISMKALIDCISMNIFYEHLLFE